MRVTLFIRAFLLFVLAAAAGPRLQAQDTIEGVISEGVQKSRVAVPNFYANVNPAAPADT